MIGAKITIIESFEIEGEPVKAHGKQFRFFGTAKSTSKRWFGLLKPVLNWEWRFYAEADGDCYNFVSGQSMPLTSEIFKDLLKTKVFVQNEEAYLKLLEQAKKIS